MSKKPPAPLELSGESPEVVEIGAGEFKNTCLELMDEVNRAPKHYLITRHGRPVARLVPPDAPASSPLGFMRGSVLASDDIVAPDFESWGEPG